MGGVSIGKHPPEYRQRLCYGFKQLDDLNVATAEVMRYNMQHYKLSRDYSTGGNSCYHSKNKFKN